MPDKLNIPRVFFDSDVVIAGAASKNGASFALLQLAEIRLIKGFITNQVIDECRRNLQSKIPHALPIFDKIIENTLDIAESPSQKEISLCENMAHPKDAPILAAALKIKARFLLTFNIKDYYPMPELGLSVVTPQTLLVKIRHRLSSLSR